MIEYRQAKTVGTTCSVAAHRLNNDTTRNKQEKTL